VGLGCKTERRQMMTRLIDADKLKEELQKHHDFFIEAWKENGVDKIEIPIPDKSRMDEITNCIAMVVNAPTVKSTVWVTIRDQFGNEIIGYEDQTRNLIFTGYGIITTELAQQKKYTIIENKEWRGTES
jgi:hypothetical protein